jgi:hemolysin III
LSVAYPDRRNRWRPPFRQKRFRTLEERLNSLTHGAGAILALVGAATLVLLGAREGDAVKITSLSVYGAMLVFLYVASTLYHTARGSWKPFCRRLDHTAIYLLIAGTYTPFTLIALRGAWGWSLFCVVWGLALFGIAQELWSSGRKRVVSMVLYPAMGWVGIVAIVPLVQALSPAAVAWVFAGGICYTVGIVFYALSARLAYAHPIWHLFVLAGSACHYVAVLRYLV